MAEINLYNMDCMEAMKEMPDKAFDLAIVDPPYGIGAGMGTEIYLKKTEKWTAHLRPVAIWRGV
jgi:DNA modification methylase